jgi:hypothetical protein
VIRFQSLDNVVDADLAARAVPPCDHEWTEMTGRGCLRCNAAEWVRAALSVPEGATPTPLDVAQQSADATMALVEAAVAAALAALRVEVEGLIAEAGGLCVVPSDDSYICETRELRAVLALIDKASS